MAITSEYQITLCAAGVILVANLFAMGLFVIYAKLPESKTKEAIRNIIFELDRFVDDMENADKRRVAIQQINEVLGWRKLVIPSPLIGWIIDREVATIRKMQKATNTPNLHEEE